MLIYRGPSELDQSPIVAILTGIDEPSENPKTGEMAQLFIMPALMSPLAAIDAGRDYGVCGNCPARPWNDDTCYCNMRTPTSVWRKWTRGGHPYVAPLRAAAVMREMELDCRLGAWGDPMALKYRTLSELTTGIGHTGYTHQHGCKPSMYRHLLMASVDSDEEQSRAAAAGWRTFRCKAPFEPVKASEIVCPASAEAWHRTVCADCLLCDGANTKRDIVIDAHGNGGKRFINLRRVQ